MNDVSIPLDGRYQPPLANGEVVFDQPWQGRVFGLAILLAEQDTFQWSDLQQSLIDVVAEWDNETDGRSGDYPYYELFAEALSRLMVQAGLLMESEVFSRDAEILARPHGHDHAPSHDQDH